MQNACQINIPHDSHFTLENIPFGVFSNSNKVKQVGTRIGDFILSLCQISHLLNIERSVFESETLNKFISLGKLTCSLVRKKIKELLLSKVDLSNCLFHVKDCEMHLPLKIGDYTDFYSSKEHATNVGTMFRGKENALMPNWVHMPIGYHGRASSIVVSGTQIKRPFGQIKPSQGDPEFKQTQKLDFELEMAFVIGKETKLGERISVDQADDHIFGVVLMNDWSARDIQAWEYVPLGPFLGKSFATTISPWVVTLEALEPFLTPHPVQDPLPLSYLQDSQGTFYVDLTVKLSTNSCSKIVSKSNLKYMYWTFRQQIAHHTSNGCNMNIGDLCGTGTLSGPTKESFGSMLELSWNGADPIKINTEERTFLHDFDSIEISGACIKDGRTILGFGSCEGTIIP